MEHCHTHSLQVIDIFSDEAVSGMKQHRPEYDRMMDQYRAGLGANVVVIYDQSRMFRDMVEWFQFRKALQAFGARVISVTQPLVGGDLLDPAVFLNEGAMALFNQMHILMTRQKVVEKMRFMAGQGKTCGGLPPLGYNVDKDGRYVINEAEAEAVRMIFKMHAAGASYGEIIQQAGTMGYRTKRGKPFGQNSIHDLLRNEKYIGVLVYGATQKRPNGKRNMHGPENENAIRMEGAVPAIVDRETWDKVQKRMESRRQEGGRHTAKREYMLAGKVFCGKCGFAMVVMGSNVPGKQAKYRYYKCGQRQNKKGCDAREIGVALLEREVAQAVAEKLGAPGAKTMLTDAMKKYREDVMTEARPQVKILQGEKEKIQKEIDNLVSAVAQGFVSETIRIKLAEHEARKARLEAEEQTLKRAAQRVELTDEEIEDAVQKIAGQNPESENGRRALLAMVTRVVVFDDHIDVYTLLGDGPEKGPGKTDEFINNVGDGDGSPKKENQTVPRFGSLFLAWAVGIEQGGGPQPASNSPPGCCLACEGRGPESKKPKGEIPAKTVPRFGSLFWYGPWESNRKANLSFFM